MKKPNKEQITVILRWLLGMSGPVYALAASYGVSADRFALWANLVIAIVPPGLAWAWDMWDNRHKATLTRAGEILSAPAADGRPSGVVIVNTEAGNGAAAAAQDPAVGNVRYEKKETL